MKKITVFLLAVFCLGMIGCSKDAEIEAFITENEAVLKDITAKIDANPTAAGVDEAQKSFDAKKASLKAKWDGIKGAVGMQVSDATKKKLEDSMNASGKALIDVSTKHSMKLATDPGAVQKFTALMKEYGELFK
jgi:hypothetical protein